MTFAALGAALLLAAYLFASALLSVLAAVQLARGAARHSAREALAWRLMPSCASLLLVLGMLLPSYVSNEPRVAHERLGMPLLVCAAAAASLFLTAAVRVVASLLLTRRFVRRCAEAGSAVHVPGWGEATRVDVELPLVAVVGVRRPRLLVSSAVLELLAPPELLAVARHERAHAAARHNLGTLLARACPDPLALVGLGRHAEHAVHAAMEREADAEAAAGSDAAATALASALLKVARLHVGPRPPQLLWNALYDGAGVEARVRRLLDGVPAAPRARPSRWWLALLGASVAAYPAAAHAAYEAAEQLARLLT